MMENISNSIDKYDPAILIEGCQSIGLSLSEEMIRQFIQYYQLLYEKNKVMNLTTVTEWSEVQTRHFLDSLLVCKAIDLGRVRNVLDLGTGAGFPGIPLKIAFPHIRILLADSLNKRILFLNDVIGKLGLSGIQTVHGRAEDLGRQKENRASFDLVVSRAVANLSSLSEYCLPFVRKGGFFISYKSSDIEEERKKAERAVRILGGGEMETEEIPLPGTDVTRCFIRVRKEKETPGRYPRKAGTPIKDPL